MFATLALGALLARRRVSIDWLGLRGRDGLRVALAGGRLGGAALLYFGVLLAAGCGRATSRAAPESRRGARCLRRSQRL